MSYRIDLHIHSNRYSACAQTLDPYEIASCLSDKGIDAAVLAEHDTRWENGRFAALQAHDTRCELFNGMELSAEGKYHFVLLGIIDDSMIRKGMAAEEAIDAVHQQGGAVILAHPFRTGVPPLKVLKLVDAIELGSTSFTLQESRLTMLMADELKKPMVASSDAHALERVGWGYTEFPQRPENESHLCAMIKAGLGVPILSQPFIRG